MVIEWSEEKEAVLMELRGISLTLISKEINAGRYDIEPNPSRDGQVLFIVTLPNIKNLIGAPAVPTANGYFLKTAYESRKLSKARGKR
ncbi:MAG: hypothetical protein FWE37_01030 [Spirochaetaceae bacterium]|nr:hypothetical protein [Spirochaetaceae bacterium]